MDVPGRVRHDDIEFAQTVEIEVLDVAVDPLAEGVFQYLFLRGFLLLRLVLQVVDVLAIGVMAGVEMWAVPHRLVCGVIDEGSEVALDAAGASHHLQTAVSGAVLAVFKPVLVLEGLYFALFLETRELVHHIFK